MKFQFFALLSCCLFLSGCSEPKEHRFSQPIDTVIAVVPGTVVEKSMLYFNTETSLWILDGLPFSGFSVSYHPDGSLKEKFGILNGKKENVATQWFLDGHTKDRAHYHKGKLHGAKKTWTPDTTHVLISHLNYRMGRAHGEQTKWYTSGELYKKLNLIHGKEEGIQQAFRKNGVIYANYEAREGRIFGLKKTTLCFGLEDENVKFKK